MIEAAQKDVLALIQELIASETTFLTELGPMILAAATFGIAKDTRAFARRFEVAHALVIRECTHLEDDLGLLTTQSGDGASGRLQFALTPAGEALMRNAS